MSAFNRKGSTAAKPGRHARRDDVQPGELAFPELHEQPDVDETPTVSIVGVVVDQAPQPAQAPGLVPVPVPAIPDAVRMTAAGPRHRVPTVGAALPARITAWERDILGGLSPHEATAAVAAENESWQARADEMAAFWEQTEQRFARGPEHYVREKTLFDLDQIGRRSAWIRQELVERPYEFGPPRRPRHALPRRVPGAFRAQIEGSRGELAAR